MANYNNDLLEILEDKTLLIVEKWKVFNFKKKEDETEYIKKVNYNLQKHYTLEWKNHVIINLDYDTIKPFTRYCLKDVYKSLEYKAIIFNRIFIFIIFFFILLITFLLFWIKSTLNKNTINTTSTTSTSISWQIQKTPTTKITTSQYDIIQEFETPTETTDNKWGGTIYYWR